MGDRIDYIRVAYRGDAEGSLAWKNGWSNVMAEYAEPRGLELKAVCDFSKFYDNAQRAWVDTFEAWGVGADYAFDNMPALQRGAITRFDYRVEVEEPAVGIRTVYDLVVKNKGRSRRTITRIDSPKRTKKGGRDAGGDFLAVGSRESDRRSSYYRRSGEPWALEVQFGKDAPLKIFQEATRLYLDTPGMDYPAAFRSVAYNHFTKAIQDHFYLTVGQIDGSASADEIEGVHTLQESLLEDFDFIWNKSDPVAKEVITEKVIAEAARRAIIEKEGLEEPPDLWL